MMPKAMESLENKTLVVTTIKVSVKHIIQYFLQLIFPFLQSPPYATLAESAKKLVGNDAFEGYAVDLISEIANVLKFNFTFKWVDDGNYGSKKEDSNEWNGMIGELRDGVRNEDKIDIFDHYF